MAKYKVVFKNKNGDTFEEVGDYESRVDVIYDIQSRGLYPISVKREFKVDVNNIILTKAVSKNKTADFLEILGDTLSSGLTLTDATGELIKTEKAGYLSVIVKDIDEKLRRGIPLSDSLESYPTFIKESDIHLIRSGETTGTTDEVLQKVSDNYRKTGEFMKSLIGSLIYPAVILILALIVIYVLVVVLVPAVSEMYDQLEGELPYLTTLVVSTSESAVDNLLIIAITVLIVIVTAVMLMKNKRSRYQIDRQVLRLPYVGNLLKLYETYKISYVLATLLEGGVATNKTLDILTRVVKNSYIERELVNVKESVEAGGITLSEAFGKTNHVMPVFMQNLRSGERTGNLTEKLERLSVRLEKDLNKSLDTIKSTISPIMIAVLAVFVGVLMYAVMTPVYSVMDYM